jgi:L-threonylcarbamoyladenylate synthase
MTDQIDATLIARADDCLRAGGVVLLPTDTVYGLAIHPERPEAADRLFAMKRRPRTRNLPIMVSEIGQLAGLGVEITEAAHRLIETFFPGPLSVALGLRLGAAPAWLAGRVEIAVRAGGGTIALQAGRLVQLQDSAVTTSEAGGSDNKANIKISINGLIISIVLAGVMPRIASEPWMLVPVSVLRAVDGGLLLWLSVLLVFLRVIQSGVVRGVQATGQQDGTHEQQGKQDDQ